MKPLIITTGAHVHTADGYLQNLLWQVYMDGIIIGGGLPVLVTDATQADAVQLAIQSNGLFLSGGMDVSPRFYGQSVRSVCGPTDAARDRIESHLIRAFINAGKPILGICRGCQMLNTYFGGTLLQDIHDETGCDHPYNSVHEVRALHGSILDSYFGPQFLVNSLHHQAIGTLGKGLVPIAYAENAPFVEAFVHRELPILGIQWHPERMTGTARMSPDGPDMAPLLRHFIAMCSKLM